MTKVRYARKKETTPKGEESALVVADKTNHIEVWTSVGSDIEETNRGSLCTALHHPALDGHPNLLQMVLRHKANVNARSFQSPNQSLD